MSAYWRDENPTASFTGRAADYARHRLSWPAQAVDAILDGLGEPGRLVAADIGAGTGLMSRLLAERGTRVLAVEPNEDMRREFEPHAGVELRSGRAEDTGLEDDSVQLVVCAQSFHWCEPTPSFAELHRVLAPGGRLAITFNERLHDEPFEREYHELLRELKPPWRKDQPPHGAAASLRETELFELLRVSSFEHDRRFDLESLCGRTFSLSYAPRAPDAVSALRRRLEELVARHAGTDGRIRQRYRAQVHVARARPDR